MAAAETAAAPGPGRRPSAARLALRREYSLCGVTWVCAVPAILTILAAAGALQWRSLRLRFVRSAFAPFLPAVAGDFEQAWGVPHPLYGERIVAYVVPASMRAMGHAGPRDEADGLRDALRGLYAEHCVTFKQSAENHVVDSLPKGRRVGY